MAHFAEIRSDNNVVINVSVICNIDVQNNGGDYSIQAEEMVASKYSNKNIQTYWKQTSYNTVLGIHNKGGTPFRKNYAGVGFTYDPTRDAFIPPKPIQFPSSILDENTCSWIRPVPYPNDEKQYFWDEESISWKESISL